MFIDLDQIKRDEHDWVVMRLSKNLMGRDHLRDLGIDGSTVLHIRKCAYRVTLMGFPVFARLPGMEVASLWRRIVFG
jgi:hypothetical protein